MDISNLANTEIQMSIGDKSFKLKRLTLLDLYSSFETDIKKDYMNSIIELAQMIKNEKERITFQKEAIREVPRGKLLEEEVRNRMDSVDGGIKILHIALNKLNKVSLEEVRAMISNPHNSAQIATIMDFIIGSDVVEDKVPEDGKIVIEKKTI
jgi:hypothetical protein